MDIYEKSHETLKKIVDAQERLNFKIILIGGWGVYCYNPYMKSKDIDFLIKEGDFWKLRDFLESLGFRETGKVLEKKGFALLVEDDKIEVDVYDKEIGSLEVKQIFDEKNFTIRNFNNRKVMVASLDLIVVLKIISASQRIGTGKGMKDVSDILAIFDRFFKDIDFDFIFSRVDRKVVCKVLSIIFSDYKNIRNLYPINFLKFEKMKKSLKLIGVVD